MLREMYSIPQILLIAIELIPDIFLDIDILEILTRLQVTTKIFNEKKSPCFDFLKKFLAMKASISICSSPSVTSDCWT